MSKDKKWVSKLQYLQTCASTIKLVTNKKYSHLLTWTPKNLKPKYNHPPAMQFLFSSCFNALILLPHLFSTKVHPYSDQFKKLQLFKYANIKMKKKH